MRPQCGPQIKLLAPSIHFILLGSLSQLPPQVISGSDNMKALLHIYLEFKALKKNLPLLLLYAAHLLLTSNRD